MIAMVEVTRDYGVAHCPDLKYLAFEGETLQELDQKVMSFIDALSKGDSITAVTFGKGKQELWADTRIFI